MNRLLGRGIAAVMLLAALPVLAGHHAPVDRYSLEVGKTYIVRQPRLYIQNHWKTQRLGVWVFSGGILKIRKRRGHGETRWYLVRRIMPATLDRSRDHVGWVKATGIELGRVFRAH